MKPLFPVFLFFVMLIPLSVPLDVYGQEIINEVFLLEKPGKLLAFSGLKNNWFERKLRPSEKIVGSKHDGNVAVAYTTERALAFSAITGRWTEERFRISEAVVNVTAQGNIAAVVTSIRALGFSARTGIWVESQFNIGE